ncbi:MAG: WD40/YVTN/BNR-like repeat-containing protein [Acidobacteriota bacterium]
MKLRSIAVLSLFAFPAFLTAATPKKAAPREAPAAPQLDPPRLKAFKARPIGPAVMGGRVSDIALDPENPYAFYIGFATGGVAKTSNNGATFQGVFEKEPVASIGAIAVAPSEPKTVWVGTGEANDRNSSAWGDGVYLSTDGGETWTNVGLKSSRAIARIAVDPKDPKTAWVAAAGNLWAPGGERGLFVTRDGGKTWKAALQAPAPYGDRVGCGDVALDPSDPTTIYAVLYARQRRPWSFTSGPAATDGKDLGGIFKSADGGATWKKLEKGLPARTARIGLAVSPKSPRIVYAVVESDEAGTTNLNEVRSKSGGVFRSDDGGETWTRTSPLDPRPFYFSQVRVDPENPERVYVLGFALHVSEDGGKSFREDRFGKVHPDNHALAIDPRHPKRLVLGNDGGAYQSFDGGKSWEHLSRFAAGEFYRISLDSSMPYRICGGLQDNQNWVGPSRTRSKEGIRNSDWLDLGGGDGFSCVFDPNDSNILYSESQSGALFRFDLSTGFMKRLRPSPSEGQPAFRFHWNSPLIGSRHEKGVLYLAGNRVFRLTDRGEKWSVVSGDLSTQDASRTSATGSGAENYGVVYTLSESPLQKGLLWAGTDDGKAWVTEDDGGHWTDLTGNLPPEARGLWMGRIEASAHDAKVAYLAVETHRSGKVAPLAYRTADLGRSWQSVTGDLPATGPVKVVREDPKNASLLFAGTEFGLFASLDRGGHWTRIGELPTVAVDDIAIHPRERDLVAATHGRSLYVIDDITPLEGATPEILGEDAHLFPPRPASAFVPMEGFADWSGAAVYRGENPKEGAALTFWIREYTGDEVEIEIQNALEQPVAKIKAAGAPGFHRVIWDLKPSKELLTEYGGEGALFVRPGEYTVTLKHGKTKSKQKLEVSVPPGIETR